MTDITRSHEGEKQATTIQLKIDDSKILKLSDEKIENHEMQILKVECECFKAASTQIANFSFENFSKVFVIVIKLKKLVSLVIMTEFETSIIKKILDDRPIILEISSDKAIILRVKHRGKNEFLTIKSKQKKENLNDEFKKNGLTIDVLLAMLNGSLLSADYSNVIVYVKNTNTDPIIHALNISDELSVRVIRLFNNEVHLISIQSKILLYGEISSRSGLFFRG